MLVPSRIVATRRRLGGFTSHQCGSRGSFAELPTRVVATITGCLIRLVVLSVAAFV
jgi:hypothetical protein